MTVAYALSERTGFPVFHNHMSIEMVLPFFEWGSEPFKRLNGGFRNSLLQEASKSDFPGFIFTYCWALDDDRDKAWVDEATANFTQRGWLPHYVELAASMEARIYRSQTEFKLSKKPSQRDTERYQETILKLEEQYRFNTNGDFLYPEQHLKLETTEMSAEQAASLVVERFGFAD